MDKTQVKIIKRCQRSASFFIDNFAKLQHPKKGITDFKLFSYQKDCLKEFRDNRFVIFRKVRQSGISTLCGAYALWYAMFFSDKTILIVSKRDDDAKTFLRRNVKFLYQNLPKWMRDLWPLETPDGVPLNNEHEIGFRNGSRIKSLPASDETLRSHSSSLNIIDEAAFIPRMDKMWAGGAPTLIHGGSVIVISTSNGVGNWYEQTYTDAIEGKNFFHPIEINWWDMDWEIPYHDELTGKTEIISPTKGLRKCKTAEEKRRYGKYISPWLEDQYRSLVKKEGEGKFRQEILAEFLGSGATVLPRDALYYIGSTIDDDYKTIGQVKYYNPITEERTILDFQNKLWCWKHSGLDNEGNNLGFQPVKNFQYVIGADPTGGESSDPAGLVVWCLDTMEQVAEYNGKCLPDTFAKMVDYIGRIYNNALVVPERTGLGLPFCQDLQNNICYPNLYRHETDTDKMKRKYGKVGFPTTQTYKASLNKALIDYLSPEEEWTPESEDEPACYKVRSIRLRKELEIYVYKGNKTEAEDGEGNHDDLTIAAGLGLVGINQAVMRGGNSLLVPYNDPGFGEATLRNPERDINAIRKGVRGGGQLMIPMKNPLDQNVPRTAEDELHKFMTQLGGVYTDSDLRKARLENTRQRRHQFKSR